MRVVVIGADGLIGRALQVRLQQRAHTVFGTTRRAGESGRKDLSFLDLSATALPSIPPADVAIFCAAMSKFADCRNSPDLARRVNVAAPIALAKEFVQRGGRAVMLSSSVVFDCLSPQVDGDRAPAPRSDYGRMSAAAEAGILALGGNVVRLTKIITAQTGRLSEWVNELEAGKTLRAFSDHRFCPITVECAINAIVAVIEQRSSGIFQVSGAEDISYADAARHLANRLGLPRSRIHEALAVDNGIPENEVTPFTSLDGSRLRALTGYVPLAPHAVIDEVFSLSFSAARAQ